MRGNVAVLCGGGLTSVESLAREWNPKAGCKQAEPTPGASYCSLSQDGSHKSYRGENRPYLAERQGMIKPCFKHLPIP